MANYIQHPCTRDCTSRSSTCHAECDAYLEYERVKQELYAANARVVDACQPSVGRQRQINRVKQLKKNRRWHK